MSQCFSDDVSKMWIVRIPHRALSVEGFVTEYEAIDRLIRQLLTWSETIADRMSDAEEAARILRIKAKIHETVEYALKHMDERETEEVNNG